MEVPVSRDHAYALMVEASRQWALSVQNQMGLIIAKYDYKQKLYSRIYYSWEKINDK